MKYTQIFFKIETEENENKASGEFMIEYDQDGNCSDGLSFNRMHGWTNYTAWHQGWRDEVETEKLNEKIVEYSRTMDLEQRVADMEETDIDKPHKVLYEGTEYTLTCTDIDEYEA